MNTNRTLALMIAVLGLAVLPGCWTISLQPLYEKDDPRLTYDPALIGVWQSGPDSPITITGDPSAGDYTVETTDEQSRFVYDAHLVQLGSYRFLDLIPTASYDTTGKPHEVEPGYVRVHSLIKVNLEGDLLFLTELDDAKLCAAAKKEKLSIGDCVDDDFVFTARTAALQDYFLKHANDPNVFEKNNPDEALHRQRTKPGAGK